MAASWIVEYTTPAGTIQHAFATEEEAGQEYLSAIEEAETLLTASLRDPEGNVIASHVFG